ncbi:MAG: hypothetical protein L0Y35_07510 [Flammeovirgaceae bacterium]|nr:hypothetical protein [Flammeovirgaceae bacterium]
MLQDKYLPQYHFDERHTLHIHAPAEKIFPTIEHLDFRRSFIIRLLFKLRGMPSAMLTTEGLERNRFFVLERVANEEIIIGLIGQFWKPSGNLQIFKPHEFIPFDKPGFAKGSWSFRLIASTHNTVELETTTRIQCTDESSRRKFSRYWFFIKPFSGLIRKEILKAIKVKAEMK